MSMLRYSTPWTRQPQGGVGINLGHPLAQGLALVSQRSGLIRPGNTYTPLAATGNVSVAPGIAGVGPTFTSSGANRYSATLTTSIPSTEGFTLEVLCAVTASPNLGGYFALNSGSGRGILSFGGGNNRNIYFWGNGADLASGVDWRTDGKLQHVFITSAGGSGTSMVFYRDGVQIASGTTPGIVSLTNPTLHVGDFNNGWNATPTGTIFKTAYYRRALSALEVFSLYFNSWQVFAPLTCRIWVGAAAAGGASNAPRYFHRTQAGQA